MILHLCDVKANLIAAGLRSVTGCTARLTQGAHSLNCSVPAVSSLEIVNVTSKPKCVLGSHVHVQNALPAL